MIPHGMQVFVAIEPVDLRAGFERLSGLVRERLGYELTDSALFVFFGKRRDTIKVVFVDGTGRCVFHKKLARGTFAALDALAPGDTHLELDLASFETLLDGLPLTQRLPSSPSPGLASRRRRASRNLVCAAAMTRAARWRAAESGPQWGPFRAT